MALRTLGALTLSGAADPERSAAIGELNARPRALAVLLRLAMADGPVSRDLLTEEFWGDRDPERARHSLADALSAIRRAFGRESVSQRSPQLVFRPETRLIVDAVEFSRAIQAKRDGDALALYRGDFLDGVFIDRAPRFDQWAMQRRFSLREQFVESAEREYRRLAAAGAHDAAVAVALRWQAAAPDEPASTRAWLESMVASGTASALRRGLEAWGEHVRRLAADDETPDDALAAYAADLKRRYEALPAAPAIAPTPLPPRQTPPPGGQVAAPDGLGPGATPRAAAGAVIPRRRGPWLAIAAVTAVVVAVVATLATRRDADRPPPWIVVADVETAGVDSTTLGAFALATRTALESDGRVFVLPDSRALELARLSSPEAARVDAALADVVARRSGATAIVVPVLMQSGQRLRSALRIVEPGLGAQVVQGPDVSRDSLLHSLDGLIAQARSRIPGRSRKGREPLPDVATPSLAALSAYASGLRASKEQRIGEGVTLLREAIAIDSTFAIAHAALGQFLYLLNQPAAGESAFVRAMAMRSRVPVRDRMTIEASRAYAHAEYDSAASTYDRWLRQHPEDRVVRSRLALAYMMAGRDAESAREHRRVLADDSLDADAWIDLAKVLGHTAQTRDSAAMAMQRGLALVPTRLTDVFTIQSFGSILVLSGRADSAAAVFRLLTTRDSSLAGRGHRWLGMLALWEGQPLKAVTELERAVALQGREPLSALRTRWLAATAYEMRGDTLGTARNLDAMLALTAMPRAAEPRILWYAGALLARAGRVGDARLVLSRLQQRMVRDIRTHRSAELMLQAEIAGASGQPREAVALARQAFELDAMPLTAEGGALAFLRAGLVDSTRARLALITADQLSFGWEGSMIQRLHLTSRAAAHQAAGDTLSAARDRRALRALVTRPEPAFATWVARAGFLGLAETPGRPAP